MIKDLINNLNSKYKINFSLLFVLMPVVMMLETLSIATVFPILSSLSGDNFTTNYQFLNNILDYEQINVDKFFIYLTFFFLFLVFVKNLILIFYTIFEGKTVYSFQEYLSSKIFSILISQPYIYHINSKSSDFVAKIKNEISNFTLVIISILSILAEGFILIGIMVLLILFDYKIFLQLFLFLTISIGFFISFYIKKLNF
jgi:ABC-type multidrug transport system fused ATPase/permease subunit